MCICERARNAKVGQCEKRNQTNGNADWQGRTGNVFMLHTRQWLFFMVTLLFTVYYTSFFLVLFVITLSKQLGGQ